MVLGRLHQSGSPVNLVKSVWCSPQQECAVVVSRLGVEPSQAKADVVNKLWRAETGI